MTKDELKKILDSDDWKIRRNDVLCLNMTPSRLKVGLKDENFSTSQYVSHC